jgi:hypothetical protein
MKIFILPSEIFVTVRTKTYMILHEEVFDYNFRDYSFNVWSKFFWTKLGNVT